MPYARMTQNVDCPNGSRGARLVPKSPRLNLPASSANWIACPGPSGMPVKIRITTTTAPTVRTTLWMASVHITASMPPISVYSVTAAPEKTMIVAMSHPVSACSPTDTPNIIVPTRETCVSK